MIETEKSSCARSVTLWFCGVPHILSRVVRRICASSGDGRAEGYGDVRRNRFRFAAFYRRDFQKPLEICTI